MRSVMGLVVVLVGAAAVAGGCDGGEQLLAPYAGTRPLVLLRVTQSFTPDVQWVGGRVAAVGVNRGSRAALDSTLVWLMRADDNTIGSHVTVGEGGDAAAVLSYGGTPVDSLDDATEYTVWLAEASALEAGLDAAELDAFTFADTTFTTALILAGNSRGDPNLGVEVRITRDQRLLGEQFRVSWTPADVGFRQIAIRRAGAGGFTDLVWHVSLPDSVPGDIHPPVVIGETPPGAQLAQAWPETGFEPDTYTLWMTTSDWAGTFSPRAPGYVYFQIFSTNFE